VSGPEDLGDLGDLSVTFDPKAALERLADDEELLREVVGLVDEEWRRQSAAIESALRQANGAALAAAAHTLRGVVGQLSSEGIAAGAAEVEHAARAGDLALAEAAWRSHAPEIESFVAAVGRWARGGP
jgi:HPt (histidine-containing phosphotransfer) domain-containing protein